MEQISIYDYPKIGLSYDTGSVDIVSLVWIRNCSRICNSNATFLWLLAKKASIPKFVRWRSSSATNDQALYLN